MSELPTVGEWATLLAPDVEWLHAYPRIAGAARLYLSGLKEGERITTSQLGEALMPYIRCTVADKELGNDKRARARQRLFKGLMALATRALADCCERGAPRPVGRRPKADAKVIQPWLWHAPTGVPNFEAVIRPSCPHCGGTL
jgi:hypothetical protein